MKRSSQNARDHEWLQSPFVPIFQEKHLKQWMQELLDEGHEISKDNTYRQG
jgi:hypothetical protein